jgi:hypothetical protein
VARGISTGATWRPAATTNSHRMSAQQEATQVQKKHKSPQDKL